MERRNKIIFGWLAFFILGICLIQGYYLICKRDYSTLEDTISIQRLDLRNKNEDGALKDAEIEALQSEVACLTEELEEMRQSWVPRSTVQIVDDVPTKSMKEFCYNIALAWKEAFTVLKKAETDLKGEE
jgi:hypothetical protein